MLVTNEREKRSISQNENNDRQKKRGEREKRATSRAVSLRVIYELIIQIASWVCWRVNRLVSFAYLLRLLPVLRWYR